MTYKILLIEKSHINQCILRAILEKQGYETFIASSSQEALTLAEEHYPELIICESTGLDQAGTEICRYIKAHKKLSDAHFIMLVRARIEERIKALEAGADDVLIKPLEPTELQAKMKTGLRFYQAKQDLKAHSEKLRKQQDFIDQELAQAASYVQSLLPKKCIGKLEIDSCLLPCSRLGGDFYDYYWLDNENFMFYLLDVSGHGIGAALPSVSIHNVLRSKALPNADFYQPESVLTALNQLFQMELDNPRFFTMWYGVYNSKTSILTYANAGHPSPILIAHNGKESASAELIGQKGTFPVGIIDDASYYSEKELIEPMSELYLFSDGAYELQLDDRSIWKVEDFQNWLLTNNKKIAYNVAELLDNLKQHHHIDNFSDDCSIVKISF
ncbi:response regulator [Leptolyngbyaceae cyanobacterium CCMR0082]|uniref:Response regulator n=2 Tax=Adonisia turfae TaxID=2950184 RepID=A0A6M0S872_9CYAN|nr:SpoIIE family protein phosphatase [Adonisia turfae]MDV3351240.1 SpoIIE family protein phosphatase [Leptothoe sp. LEGE 181152]NEZ59075.1 response regulator [Adonisia turfae CCMR0081]NEZ64694.1 response regulator [Adonisia turfae CCMR0082]